MQLIDAYNNTRARVDALERELADLRPELAGLQRAVDRQLGTEGAAVCQSGAKQADNEATEDGQEDGEAASNLENLAQTSRSDAVLHVLNVLPSPVSTSQVVAMLQISGRPNENSGTVGNALKYLVNQERIEKVGRALWAPARTQSESADRDTSVLDIGDVAPTPGIVLG